VVLPPGIGGIIVFWSTTTNADYSTAISYSAPGYSGIPTFSFDPTAPWSFFNNNLSIPAGGYRMELLTAPIRGGHPADYKSAPFQHQYMPTRCKDDYNGSSVPCAIYNAVLYDNFTPDNCPPAEAHNSYVTVPLCLVPGSVPL
jgi:hypothetical protein